MMADWAESAARSGQALALFRQAGDQTGQAWVTAAIGEYHARLGNYDLARGYARQAMEGPATGESTSLTMAWDALGVTHFRLGEPRQAIGCFLRGLALVRDLKNPLARLMTAIILAGFGDASLAAGEPPAAVEAWQQALQVLDDRGGRTSSGSAPGLRACDLPRYRQHSGSTPGIGMVRSVERQHASSSSWMP
jgi:tetratricopeptide (TPR) repeat protein